MPVNEALGFRAENVALIERKNCGVYVRLKKDEDSADELEYQYL
jgi:hypothetical protein